MVSILKYYLRIFLYWILLFAFLRVVFLVYQYGHIKAIGISEILLSFWYAIPMDISMTSYIMVIPTLIIGILMFLDRKILRIVLSSWFIIIIILIIFISIADLGLFEAWGSRLNHKAFSYLAYPEEAMTATQAAPLWLLGILFVLQSVPAVWIFLRIGKLKIPGAPIAFKIVLPVVMIFLLLIGIRGGVQTYPINKSWLYYSKHPVLNQATINGTWNAFEILVEPAEYEANPYNYFADEEAQKVFMQLHPVTADTTIKIFNQPSPNIILVLLESWSGDIIEAFGDDKNVTPQFSKLCEEGLLFTNLYSTGFRTEQGLAALISGFPSQPRTTIIRKFGKFDHLPSFAHVLDSNNYTSTYYYGGDLNFANTKTYLTVSGFDHIFGEEDLDVKNRTSWGAFDEELFSLYLDEEGIFREPFFHLLMTTTSHEPFDAPVNGGFEGDDMPQRYRNTIHYTDSCLGDFINQAKTKDWYPNTIFIITSDHGHFLPLDRKHYEHERHHIPFLLYGEVLKNEYRGTRLEKFGSHSDFPATILSQLELESGHFKWSKDMLNPNMPGYAFYSFDDGFGWVEEEQVLIFDHQLGDVIWLCNTGASEDYNEKLLHDGKSYLQVLMEDYIGFNNQ